MYLRGSLFIQFQINVTMRPIKDFSLLIIFPVFFCVLTAFSQTPLPIFNGTLSYHTTIQPLTEDVGTMEGRFNVTMNETWKRVETVLDHGVSHLVFINSSEKVSYTLLSIEKETFYIADTVIPSLWLSDPFLSGFEYDADSWKKTGKKVKIQGRKCMEYIISSENYRENSPITQIKAYIDEKAKETENIYPHNTNIKGLLVKMELETQEVNMSIILNTIKEKHITKEDLNPPREKDIISRKDFTDIIQQMQ